MDEVSVITDYIQEKAGLAADLIWGNCFDESLGEKISVTIIATGFQTMEERQVEKSQQRKVSMLTPDNAPLVRPVNTNTFIKAKSEDEILPEPVMKIKEESQADLFAGYFQSSRPIVSEEKHAANKPEEIIRHTLVEKEEESVDDVPAFEFTTQQVEKVEIPTTYQPVTSREMKESELHSIINPDENKTDESIDEQLRKSKERILRLKDLSMKLRTSGGLQELENEPAYKRKQMSLPQVPHSSESQVSRFTLSSDDGIRPNNSFLHDNVD